MEQRPTRIRKIRIDKPLRAECRKMHTYATDGFFVAQEKRGIAFGCARNAKARLPVLRDFLDACFEHFAAIQPQARLIALPPPGPSRAVLPSILEIHWVRSCRGSDRRRNRTVLIVPALP
jgi:hypothetical protein